MKRNIALLHMEKLTRKDAKPTDEYSYDYTYSLVAAILKFEIHGLKPGNQINVVHVFWTSYFFWQGMSEGWHWIDFHLGTVAYSVSSPVPLVLSSSTHPAPRYWRGIFFILPIPGIWQPCHHFSFGHHSTVTNDRFDLLRECSLLISRGGGRWGR